jgi:hypothetical protein
MAIVPRFRKGALPEETAPMLIGDSSSGDGGYVSCPSCGRPVADGLVRCAGCGVRIFLGVAASRALLFMTTGAVLGLLVGGLSVGWVMGLSRMTVEPPPAAVVVQPSPSPAPTSNPLQSAAVPSDVDPLAASALRQVVSTDAQLAGSMSSLKHELRAKPIDTGAISATLREMSAAATYGASVVGYLSAWPEAATVQGQVGRLYAQVRAIAANGLSAQLASTSAYAAAGNQMVTLLATLPATQAAEFKLGESGGLDLPGDPLNSPSPSDVPAASD